MKLIEKDNFNILMAEENYKIHAKDDVYIEAHIEDGEEVPEHFPYFFKTAYLPKTVSLEDAKEIYEEVEDGQEG